MARLQMRQAPRSRGVLVLAAAAAATLATTASHAFVSAPSALERNVAVAGATGAVMMAPFAAFAELPPLEDLPVDDLADASDEMSYLGISPFVAFGFIFVAAGWALFWVNTMVPKKQEEGEYQTYIGGGELPPDGFTNPLDPRMTVIEEEEAEDEAAAQKKKNPKTKSASSAIV
eukprot:CAMPEP_0170607654 /NCGR_PEP_ID=MMETSP0224-20130122/21169_1 /TAXON_ID=285029 /ORGANISM="Togula jolla, Strain CCCM 725" /LENGTH=173 /DNA_ID=CAMNT_0010932833 /DNA_START=56 /DNA_END=577 /DNA_ORIENTATION=+